MYRFLFSLIPWWFLAFVAVSMAPLAIETYEDYDRERSQMAQAAANGPPDIIPVYQLGDRPPPSRTGLVRFEGTLRADLGVKSISLVGTRYTYVLLDAPQTVARRGPLVAILIPDERAAQDLNALVNAADETGNLIVQGVLVPTYIGELSRRLAISDGITRQIYVVEPTFGSHTAVYADRVADAQMTFFVTLGFTVLFAVLALLRFRRWRERRAKRRAPVAARPAQTAQPPATASPWGEFVEDRFEEAASQDSALNQAAPTVAPKRAAKPAPPTPAPETVPAEAVFVSVFPGGGSGFRFKSADEIIRQSFGTLSTLTPPKRDD